MCTLEALPSPPYRNTAWPVWKHLLLSLPKALLPWWEAPWCFVLQESSEPPGEISVESSRQTKPDPPGAASCQNSDLIFKAQGRSELPAAVGKLSWAFIVVYILQVVFCPLENFYRTHETSGKENNGHMYIPFLPLISSPKTQKLMNFKGKPHQWKSAGAQPQKKGFLFAKMTNTLGMIRMLANRRLWCCTVGVAIVSGLPSLGVSVLN